MDACLVYKCLMQDVQDGKKKLSLTIIGEFYIFDLMEPQN